MTVFERLFGTPERAANALEELAVGVLEICWLVEALTDNQEKKCDNCPYEFDQYGCEDVGVALVEWLSREVVE